MLPRRTLRRRNLPSPEITANSRAIGERRTLARYYFVRGLRQRFFPEAALVVWTGLIIQTALGVLGVWARQHLGRDWSGEITDPARSLSIREASHLDRAAGDLRPKC